MTATIIILVLASATLHPLREFVIKGDATPSGVSLAVVVHWCLLAGIQTWFEGADQHQADTAQHHRRIAMAQEQ